jgi:hypothetical protein
MGVGETKQVHTGCAKYRIEGYYHEKCSNKKNVLIAS